MPLFGYAIPLIIVLLFIYGVGSLYYYFIGRHQLLPIEEEFGVLNLLDGDADNEDVEKDNHQNAENTTGEKM